MILYKSNSQKHNSNETVRVNSYESLDNLKNEYYTFDLSSDRLICIDVDDVKSREIILKMHKDNLLKDYVYSIKETGSSHFYFTINEEDIDKNILKKKKTQAFNVLNMVYEVINNDRVQLIKPDYEYHNFEYFFENKIPTYNKQDVLFNLIGYKKNDELKVFKNQVKIVDTMNALYGAMQGDGTQRGKTMLSVASSLYKYNYTDKQVEDVLTYIHNYLLGQSINETDRPDALNDILIRAKEYQLEKVKEKADRQEAGFIFYKDDKANYNVDLYKLALYLIKTYDLRVRDNKIYGFFNNKFINYSLSLKNASDILYLIISKIYTDNNLTYTYKVADYNNIKEHILKLAPLLNDESLSDMNIVLENGTMVYGKELKQYHFESTIEPHIIMFNHIKWLDKNADTFDNNLYYDAKNVIDNYLSSLVDKDNVDILWKMIATTFLYNTYHRKAFVLTGAGRNGKSTFITFLQKLNKDNYSNISINDMNSQFMGHKLNNHTLNTCSELDGVMKGTDSMLKSIIAGDKVSMDVKNDKNGIDFVNKSTLIFATNNELVIPDYTTALLDRLLFIDFNKTFANQKIENFLDTILKNEYSYFYVIEKCITYIENLDKNDWKLNSKDDTEQQKRFKHSNSLVYKWFAYFDMLNDKEELNDKALLLIKHNHLINVFNQFKKDIKELYGTENINAYGINKFNQQMKDVMKLKVVFKDNKEYFIPMSNELLMKYDTVKENNNVSVIQPEINL